MLKLHLGCGSNRLVGWVNIDIDSPVADLLHDLTRPLPFADGSVERIYAEHMIEHIEYEEAAALICECRRVLAPDGVVRMTTPDLAWLVTTYASTITDQWGDLWQPRSPGALLNEGMRSWGHRYLYDRADLRALFRSAGFADVIDCDWGVSADPSLAALESRPYNREIIVEARKYAPAYRTSAPQDAVSVVPGEKAIGELLLGQRRELERLRRERDATIDAMTAEATRQSAWTTQLVEELRTLREVIADRESVVASQSARLDDQQGRIASSEATIAAMKAEAARQSAWMAQLVEESRTLREVIADRESVVASQSARLYDQQGRITFLETATEDLTRAVRGLEAGIADRDGLVEALRINLSQVAAESAERGDFILALNQKIEALEAEAADAASASAALRAELDAARDTLTGLLATRLGRFALRRSQR